MNIIGRARNARLNQASRHAKKVWERIEALKGFSMNELVDDRTSWKEARDALRKLDQCFHEANAYNNCLNPGEWEHPNGD